MESAGVSAEHRWLWDRMLVSLAGPRAVRRIPNKGPLYRTSIHEAAHAVIGLRRGLYIREASTVPEWDGSKMVTRGHVLFGESAALPSRAALAKTCLSDHQVVRLGLALLIEPGSEQWNWRTLLGCWRRIQAETDQLLEEHWAAIETLAFRLLWDRRLEHAEIEAVLEAALTAEGL
jgi:hypothetical protein